MPGLNNYSTFTVATVERRRTRPSPYQAKGRVGMSPVGGVTIGRRSNRVKICNSVADGDIQGPCGMGSKLDADLHLKRVIMF